MLCSQHTEGTTPWWQNPSAREFYNTRKNEEEIQIKSPPTRLRASPRRRREQPEVYATNNVNEAMQVPPPQAPPAPPAPPASKDMQWPQNVLDIPRCGDGTINSRMSSPGPTPQWEHSSRPRQKRHPVPAPLRHSQNVAKHNKMGCDFDYRPQKCYSVPAPTQRYRYNPDPSQCNTQSECPPFSCDNNHQALTQLCNYLISSLAQQPEPSPPCAPPDAQCPPLNIQCGPPNIQCGPPTTQCPLPIVRPPARMMDSQDPCSYNPPPRSRSYPYDNTQYGVGAESDYARPRQPQPSGCAPPLPMSPTENDPTRRFSPCEHAGVRRNRTPQVCPTQIQPVPIRPDSAPPCQPRQPVSLPTSCEYSTNRGPENPCQARPMKPQSPCLQTTSTSVKSKPVCRSTPMLQQQGESLSSLPRRKAVSTQTRGSTPRECSRRGSTSRASTSTSPWRNMCSEAAEPCQTSQTPSSTLRPPSQKRCNSTPMPDPCLSSTGDYIKSSQDSCRPGPREQIKTRHVPSPPRFIAQAEAHHARQSSRCGSPCREQMILNEPPCEDSQPKCAPTPPVVCAKSPRRKKRTDYYDCPRPNTKPCSPQPAAPSVKVCPPSQLHPRSPRCQQPVYMEQTECPPEREQTGFPCSQTTSTTRKLSEGINSQSTCGSGSYPVRYIPTPPKCAPVQGDKELRKKEVRDACYRLVTYFRCIEMHLYEYIHGDFNEEQPSMAKCMTLMEAKYKANPFFPCDQPGYNYTRVRKNYRKAIKYVNCNYTNPMADYMQKFAEMMQNCIVTETRIDQLRSYIYDAETEDIDFLNDLQCVVSSRGYGHSKLAGYLKETATPERALRWKALNQYVKKKLRATYHQKYGIERCHEC